MPYILQRVDDGKFVTEPGSRHSYSHHACDARQFPTLDAAERERCENERIFSYTPEHFRRVTA